MREKKSLLVTGIDANKVGHGWATHTCFKHAQNKPAGEQSRVALYKGHAHGGKAEAKNDEAESDARPEFLAHEVGGDLEEDVRDEEEGQDDVEAVASEVGIFS